MEGWIKLHRQIVHWEWYTDSNTFRIFIHCLLRANSEPAKWRGVNIERGQFFTSVNHIADELGLTLKQVRISLDKLKKSENVAYEGASNGTMITVLKYETYQIISQTKGKPKGEAGANEGRAKGDKQEGKEGKEYFSNEKLNKAFFDFIENRIKIKKPMTENAINLALEELDKLTHDDNEKIAIINQSIFYNYLGLFPLKQKNIPAAQTQNRPGERTIEEQQQQPNRNW
jgi:hypothetical protein